MIILRYDHLVLTVKNIDRSVHFYGNVLGMRIETFGQGRTAAHFGDQKINFQEVGQEIDPKAAYPTPGSGDFCLITSDSPNEVLRQLAEQGVAVELGPVQRTGALGPITSIYVRDPDHNIVEISSYSPHIRIRPRSNS